MSKVAPYVAFLASIVMALVAVPDAVRSILISQEVETYKTTRGQLLQHNTKEHQKGPKTEMVKFRYTVGSREYDGDNYWTRGSDTPELVKPLIRKEKSGKKTILIHYDPNKPKRAVIRKDFDIWIPLGIIGVTIMLMIGSVMSFLTEKRKRKIIERNQPRSRRDA